MGADNEQMAEGAFIAWSLSGTADYQGADVQISWGLTVDKHTTDLPSIKLRLPSPFVNATPRDMLREALYQYAEKL